MSKEIISNIILVLVSIMVFFVLCHDHLIFYYIKIIKIFNSTIFIKNARIVPLQTAEVTDKDINTQVLTTPIKKVYVV
jgi:hypothetical protein